MRGAGALRRGSCFFTPPYDGSHARQQPHQAVLEHGLSAAVERTRRDLMKVTPDIEEDAMLFWSLPEIFARAYWDFWFQAIKPVPVKVSAVKRSGR